MLGELSNPIHAQRLDKLLTSISILPSSHGFIRVMKESLQYQLVGDYTHAFHSLVQATYLIPKPNQGQEMEEEVGMWIVCICCTCKSSSLFFPISFIH